mmetsp:Transcript_73080/g.136575  ORF Transcript_73080/g.136575 Transcript_73080/m.136575 type:complete len:426 (-) Transcript_73080:73-1350(-)
MAVADQSLLPLEAHVFPVFFYNDMLVRDVGDELRLRLFEPRYRIMCQRMLSHPYFLFMPNFEGYLCNAGDVGFIIHVTHLEEHPRSRTFSIGGKAILLAAVEATWVEPQTHELHHAAVRKLDARTHALDIGEVEALRLQMLQHGWQQAYDENVPFQLLFNAPPTEPGQISQAQVLFGLNWKSPPLIHMHLLTNGLPAQEALAPLRKVWKAAGRSLPARSGHVGTEVGLERAVHVHDHSLSAAGVQSPSSAKTLLYPLVDLMRDVENMLGKDAAAAQIVFGLQLNLASGKLGKNVELLPPKVWNMLLRHVCLAAVRSRRVQLPSARLSSLGMTVDASDCLPFLRNSMQPGHQGRGVQVCNGTNVRFYLPADVIDVTAESAAIMLGLLSKRLNGFRAAVIERARHTRGQVLSALKDDVLGLVYDFLC